MWALALENLDDRGREELLRIKAACSTQQSDTSEETAAAIQTAKKLYRSAGVFSKAAEIVANERQLAADAIRIVITRVYGRSWNFFSTLQCLSRQLTICWSLKVTHSPSIYCSGCMFRQLSAYYHHGRREYFHE